MRSGHRYPRRRTESTSIYEWHTDQREVRKKERWVPYSLRIRGGVFQRILPQILLSGVFAIVICTLSYFNGDVAFHSPILFPVFGFVVGLAITFRMQSSYARWWEGRTQWDKLSAVSRSCARTIWMHAPETEDELTKSDKLLAIHSIRTFAVALKHHLRGARDWNTCADLMDLLKRIPGYSYDAINHPLTLTMHLSSSIEHFRHISGAPLDTQVLTHLLLHIETFTGILSACERLLRTPVPLGYNIAISRIVWIFIIALPSQLWTELRWFSIAVTLVTAYALFALAEVGLEIENPWGEGPNDLDLDRYCKLLALDLEEITAHHDIGHVESNGTN